ncbi:MAG: type II 3-dehydroquinate dehydratase [Candidatus Omnitrophica bacterium]|nr:type II 3-dehydroquinate dehydratase [Candidatus Omnitrophota bacterium]
MKRILVIHGPNLNLLGEREPNIYGFDSIEEINKTLEKIAKKNRFSLKIIQSNHEGEIVEVIGRAKEKFNAIIINPAAYTHTSIAIRDAISAVGIPTIEVHLSNIYGREEFRQKSLIAPVSKGQICGFGKNSYVLALLGIIELLKNE